ncbi:MAG: DUF2480 family protein [Flavipsychrobacter sp.]
MSELINKVAESGIVTIDLTSYIPDEENIAVFDLKPFLFREMILREKDYRQSLKEFDWTVYENKHVAVFCSVDAIIPIWAYMLATSYLEEVATSVFYGTAEALTANLIKNKVATIDVSEYEDKRVVLKGCGDKAIPETAYVEATQLLKPVVKSLMYGEPCSTVPIYKKKVVR